MIKQIYNNKTKQMVTFYQFKQCLQEERLDGFSHILIALKSMIDQISETTGNL